MPNISKKKILSLILETTVQAPCRFFFFSFSVIVPHLLWSNVATSIATTQATI